MSRPIGGSGTTAKPGARTTGPSRTAGGSPERSVRQRNAERFLRDLVNEMRRVTWPSRPEWVQATLLTIGLVVVLGFYTYFWDQIFTFVFGLIHK